MTHVLVTGGAGMIGAALVRRLLAEGMRVTVVDNLWRGRREWLAAAGLDLERAFHEADLARPGVLDPLLPGVDYVFHLADVVAGIGYVFANQGFILRQNLLINTHVVASVAQARHLKGYIYVGTACSFPQGKQTGPDAPPLREGDLFPADPESAYGWSKLMGQIEAGLMAAETGIPVALPILHNVYGAPCDFSRERSQVIPALVRRAIEYPAEGDFTVWGNGAQGRAFVHVDDVVEGLMAAMTRGLGQGPIQIGPDRCTTIREVAETVVNVSGKNIDIRYDTTRPMGDLGRCADYARARDLLGWAPRVPLADGIGALYGWMARQMQAG
ncbi:MAG: NAD-dependent epimerase/dehydratase family protein [Gemmobacter sp.]